MNKIELTDTERGHLADPILMMSAFGPTADSAAMTVLVDVVEKIVEARMDAPE